MRERHGDPMTDGRIEEAARDALHNERRADVLATELRAPNRKIRERRRSSASSGRRPNRRSARTSRHWTPCHPPAMFRRAAAGMIDAMAVRDIRPHAYLLAGRKAAREAAAAWPATRPAMRFPPNSGELLEPLSLSGSRQGETEADALRDYAKTFEGSRKREKLGKAGHDYLDQAEALLTASSSPGSA